jgi:DNA-directed RNA polymerase subunit RPC12/RpoP
MNVTRRQIFSRGLHQACPNCGSRTLFQPGKRFAINPACPACGLKFDRGDGFFLGPFVIIYTFTVAFAIVPLLVLSIFGLIGPAAAITLGGGCAFAIPALLYRSSWSWWLMGYFYFLPEKLPHNRGALREDEEE